jgi:hypothetical protein
MRQSPFKFVIGQGSWIEEIRYHTSELSPHYWADFQRLSLEEINTIEKEVGRRLPDDFKEFLGCFGSGRFPEPYYGSIYTPEDFIHGCHGHLYMLLGSSAWASDNEQRRFYVSRGEFNPAPKQYTLEALFFEDVNLLDLLQFGTNGLSCYHQVYVGEKPGPAGYCLLTPECTMEDASPSFSEGLKKILTHHWFWNEPPEEEPPSNDLLFEPVE